MPEPAIEPPSPDEKRLLQMAEVIYEKLTSLEVAVYEIDCYEAVLALVESGLLRHA